MLSKQKGFFSNFDYYSKDRVLKEFKMPAVFDKMSVKNF